jgi:hypothetical protein
MGDVADTPEVIERHPDADLPTADLLPHRER